MRRALALLFGFSLVACAQVNSATSAIESACTELSPLVPLAGPIAPYIVAGCTADGIIKLASDPSSLAWLAKLKQQAKDFAHISRRSRLNA